MYNNTLEHQFTLARQQHVINMVREHYRNFLLNCKPKCTEVRFTEEGIEIKHDVDILDEMCMQAIDSTLDKTIREMINTNAIDEIYENIMREQELDK